MTLEKFNFKTHTLVVGIGSPHGDDRAGWRVVERLGGVLAGDTVRLRQATSPSQLWDWLEGVKRLIVCDACRGLGPPGTIERWTWPEQRIVYPHWTGTHDLSLPAALGLAEQLGRLPPEVIVWGIECETTRTGTGDLSSPIASAVDTLVERISRDLLAAT